MPPKPTDYKSAQKWLISRSDSKTEKNAHRMGWYVRAEMSNVIYSVGLATEVLRKGAVELIAPEGKEVYMEIGTICELIIVAIYIIKIIFH